MTKISIFFYLFFFTIVQSFFEKNNSYFYRVKFKEKFVKIEKYFSNILFYLIYFYLIELYDLVNSLNFKTPEILIKIIKEKWLVELIIVVF